MRHRVYFCGGAASYINPALDNEMREAGLEPARLSTLDPKSDPAFELAPQTDPSADAGGTTQSNGFRGGQGGTTISTTRLERYFNADIRVLSMWEPWAILAVAPDPAAYGEPAKHHETRHWTVRGNELPMHVAIHAAKRYDGEVKYTLGLPRFKAALERIGYVNPHLIPPGMEYSSPRPIPFGAIVGLATIVAIHGTRERAKKGLTEDDQTFGNWEPGRWAWQLENTICLPEPVPHTGRQQVLYELGMHERTLIFGQFA